VHQVLALPSCWTPAILLFMRTDTVRLLRPTLFPHSAACRPLPPAGAQAPERVESWCNAQGVRLGDHSAAAAWLPSSAAQRAPIHHSRRSLTPRPHPVWRMHVTGPLWCLGKHRFSAVPSTRRTSTDRVREIPPGSLWGCSWSACIYVFRTCAAGGRKIRPPPVACVRGCIWLRISPCGCRRQVAHGSSQGRRKFVNSVKSAWRPRFKNSSSTARLSA
jgi:hypothetical protein